MRPASASASASWGWGLALLLLTLLLLQQPLMVAAQEGAGLKGCPDSTCIYAMRPKDSCGPCMAGGTQTCYSGSSCKALNCSWTSGIFIPKESGPKSCNYLVPDHVDGPSCNIGNLCTPGALPDGFTPPPKEIGNFQGFKTALPPISIPAFAPGAIPWTFTPLVHFDPNEGFSVGQIVTVTVTVNDNAFTGEVPLSPTSTTTVVTSVKADGSTATETQTLSALVPDLAALPGIAAGQLPVSTSAFVMSARSTKTPTPSKNSNSGGKAVRSEISYWFATAAIAIVGALTVLVL